MITIEYYRFILEPKTLELINKTPTTISTCVYRQVLDHCTRCFNNSCSIERAKKCGKIFLKNHYGYVVIYYDENELNINSFKIKLCNHKKFWKDMLKEGILVK